MTILVLNAVPKKWCNFKEVLSDIDMSNIVFLTAAHVVDDFKEENFLYMESFSNYKKNDLILLRALELHEKYRFQKIIAFSEMDIVRAAELRAFLGIEGQQPASAIQFRDKVIMKETIRANSDVRVPNFARVKNVFDLLKFIDNHGYPVVVKPVDGESSIGVFVLRNKQELSEYVKNGLTRNLEVEEYIEGDMYHVDGMINEGEIKLICTSRYLAALVTFRDKDHVSSSCLLHPTNPVHQKMVDAVTEVLKAMDKPRNTAFHAECFLTSEGEVVFCEIACRPAGGRITKMIEVAYGHDPIPGMVKLQAGIPFTDNLVGHVPEKLAGAVTVMAKRGKFISAPRVMLPSWVKEYLLNVEEGHEFNDRTFCDDGAAFFVVEGATEAELVERIHAILKWFDDHSVWELSEVGTVAIC
jgi:biotin carboxylase